MYFALGTWCFVLGDHFLARSIWGFECGPEIATAIDSDQRTKYKVQSTKRKTRYMRPLVINLSDTWLIFWLVLFPLTYLLHIAEEYWGGGGYSAYLMRSHFVELSPARFLALQTLGMLLMLIGFAVSIPLRFPQTMLTIIAAVILANGVVHSARSLLEWDYTPGLITAVLLWIPLGAVSLINTWNNMRSGRFLFAVAVGSLISLLVEVIAMRGGRLLFSIARQ